MAGTLTAVAPPESPEPATPQHCTKGSCRNPIAASSSSKCQDCLDKDAAQHRKIPVQVLLDERAQQTAKVKALPGKQYTRQPAPEGFHFCHTCNKDVSDDQFNLNQATSRCIKHYLAAVAKLSPR